MLSISTVQIEIDAWQFYGYPYQKGPEVSPSAYGESVSGFSNHVVGTWQRRHLNFELPGSSGHYLKLET